MNENIERVIDELDYFRVADEMTYYAYSRLHDSISELDDLLKAQELPDVKPEKLEERTTKWLDQMTAEERLEEIAAILDDWDGYRTAKGLGGLINEVWAYALYPVKAQEPRVMTLEEVVKTERNTPIYIDQRYGMHGWDIYDGVDIQAKDIVTGAPWASNEFWGWDEYGESWRCWTSQPTEEQREATPWVEPPKEECV